MLAAGAPADPVALDQWAAGVCLFELAQGLPCFVGEDDAQLKESILEKDVMDELPPGVSDAVRSV